MKKIGAYLLVIVIGLAAGAGGYHRILTAEAAQERKKEIAAYQERIGEIPERLNEIMEPEIACKLNDLEKGTRNDLEQEEYYDSLGLLASCVEAEAGNQSVIGKRLVVDVILNRVEDPDWPDSVEGVITQPGQFSTWGNGEITRADPSQETYEAVKLELKDRLCRDIYYFTAGGYGAYGTPWEHVGDHYFSGK